MGISFHLLGSDPHPLNAIRIRSFLFAKQQKTIPSSSLLGCASSRCRTYLDKTNILALLTEALTADVKTVFADKTLGVVADSATMISVSIASLLSFLRRLVDFVEEFGMFMVGVWDRLLCVYMEAAETGVPTYHAREPLPYVRGRENQTLS
jgi:hypothetical protein